jgi:hypothetical protein
MFIGEGIVGGLQLPKVLKKHDLTMFSKYASRYLRNQVAGIQEHGQDETITKVCAEELRHDSRKGKPT